MRSWIFVLLIQALCRAYCPFVSPGSNKASMVALHLQTIGISMVKSSPRQVTSWVVVVPSIFQDRHWITTFEPILTDASFP